MTATQARGMSEKLLQQSVIQLLHILGYRTYHTYLSIKSAPGFPDIIACRGTRLLAIELKSSVGQLSAAQKEWLEALGQIPGIEVVCWYPRDWLDGTIERVLRQEA